MKFEERYKKLNTAQKQAVDTIEGPLLVVAGPGSGKTEILSLRVAKILKETQVLPSNILCLTFTDSAAVNMRDRLSKLIGQEAYKVSIHTFHSFATDCIQRYPEFFYKGAIFTPIDPITQISILEEIFDSLAYDDALKSIHPDQGYVHLDSTRSAISNLKRSGITPDEFQTILEENKKNIQIVNDILAPTIEKTVSKAVIEELKSAILELRKQEAESNQPIYTKTGFPSVFHAVSISLEEALIQVEETGKNEAVSKWKSNWFKKDDSGNKVFSDYFDLEKLESVAKIYKQYRELMHQRALFDFDDMILDLINAIDTNPRLRNELQEQFQYLLVDEFQDTNNAQMRIIKMIADAPVYEGRPNIMVVGDDDQAVYKFQGAELSNILNFKTAFTDVAVVNMTSNYRSTQDILDIATHIIRKGEHRLENLLPQLEKTLVSSNPEIKKGSIVHKVFDTSLHELHYVSRRIKRLIEEGTKPSDIAVISKRHKQLESLVPYMQGAGVPIKYEREQNVFNQPHIMQLILMARFLNSIGRKDMAEADEYLPEILAFPFWELPRMAIWSISKKSYEDRVSWLETMVNSSDVKVKNIAHFLIEMGEKSNSEPLEKILDWVIGAHVSILKENEDDDLSDIDDAVNVIGSQSESAFVSPFKQYYFSKEKFEHARAEYISFLSSLRVFVQALREYKGKAGANENLNVNDLVEFVDIHKNNNISLNDQSPFVNARDAVNLLSAHKSKGLEFDTVFVLSATDDVWAGKTKGKTISLPINLPVEPAGDSDDDKLRLFYVALTRAKSHLYITSYKVKDDGKESSTLRFLTSDQDMENALLQKLYAPESGDEEIFNKSYTPETHELLTASWLLYHTPPFLDQESMLLKSVLDNYQLSVTHLNNYLNVVKGGPQLFLEQNLLRFPQAKSPSGSYGTAVHSTMEKAGIHLKSAGSLPIKEEFLSWFKTFLMNERMTKSDFETYIQKGTESLSIYYDKKINDLSSTDLLEVNFKNQGVIVPASDFGLKASSLQDATSSKSNSLNDGVEVFDAHLTGKIDKIQKVSGSEFRVYDYKTGKAFKDWSGKAEYEKIKAYEYSRQLMFYKILVENSKDYGYAKVNSGTLDFVEPVKFNKANETIELTLNIDPQEYEKTKKLAFVVFNKIKNLDFPDVSKNYDASLKGIKQFEEDLLK